MFRVSLSALFEVYLSALLFVTLCVWVFFHWRRARREYLAERDTIGCSLCGFRFRDSSPEPVARCPQCQRLTERRRASTL